MSFTSGFPVSTPERTIFDLVADDEDPYLDDPAGHTDLLLGMSLALFQPKAPTSSYSRGREEESKSTRKLKSHWVSRRKLAQIQQGTQAIIRLRPPGIAIVKHFSQNRGQPPCGPTPRQRRRNAIVYHPNTTPMTIATTKQATATKMGKVTGVFLDASLRPTT